MSNYDPFQIYKRDTTRSHNGQVLRKKIPKHLGTVLTQEQYDEVINILIGRGYKVFPPSDDPTLHVLKSLTSVYVYPNIDLGTVVYQSDTTLGYYFHDIWPVIKNDFSTILAINNLRVQSVNFFTGLISFDLGDFAINNLETSGNPYLDFQFSDVQPTVYPVQIQFSTNTSLSLQHNFHIGFSSYTNQQYVQYCWTGNTAQYQFIGPFYNPPLVQPYLNFSQRQQIAILTALRNSDFNAFDHHYLAWSLNNVTSGNLTIDHHHFNIIVGLAIDYY